MKYCYSNVASPRHGSRASGRRLTGIGGSLVLTLLIVGCAAPKDQYPGAFEAQQRMAAEDAAASKAGANVDSQSTYLKLIDQMQREGLWFASLAHIDALEQRWGSTPETHRARADALRNTGQLSQSEEFYGRLRGTPLESAAYHGLGLLAGARADFSEAVNYLQKAQQRSPTDAVLLNDLGYANLRAGRIAEARLPLMQAMQLQPDNAQAQANLALYLEASGQKEQAAVLMEARRMPAATRAAIRESARQLPNTKPSQLGNNLPFPSLAGTSTMPDEGTTPLALKRSRWSGNLRESPKTISAPNSEPVSTAATALPSISSSRGTP